MMSEQRSEQNKRGKVGERLIWTGVGRGHEKCLGRGWGGSGGYGGGVGSFWVKKKEAGDIPEGSALWARGGVHALAVH